MTKHKTIRRSYQPSGGGGRRGFTLIELLTVMGIIVLLAGIALPSVVGLFRAGADAQAYNLLAAQLTAARALAIQESTYAGVHVQLADPDENPSLEGVCYASIVIYSGSSQFGQAPGYIPRRIPGGMAFGELSNTFVNSSGDYQGLSDIDDFTTFTIVFSPSGSVVVNVAGGNVQFNTNDNLFDDTSPNIALWDATDANDDTEGVSAVTMFHYSTFNKTGDRAAYLNESGQFLPVNVYTGQLFQRQ
ncbi:MAG: prepilin-type N-terminal cleavage/methylation domain-containing protein [Planctomycetota bacterium]|nr:prepilin-type N-terminal cleavage/methylation domain-containing protein [Planctomycetota bacterium]